jgi:hypothetical protein
VSPTSYKVPNGINYHENTDCTPRRVRRHHGHPDLGSQSQLSSTPARYGLVAPSWPAIDEGASDPTALKWRRAPT